MSGPAQPAAPRALARWRMAAAWSCGFAVMAWLAVIIVEVGAPETQFRAAPATWLLTVLGWTLGVLATVVAAVAVPVVLFPGLPRRVRVAIAGAATVAAVVPAVVAGDLGGFDDRRYFARHRAEFVDLLAWAYREPADRTGVVHPPIELDHLGVNGTIELSQVDGGRVVFVPQHYFPVDGAAGYTHVEGAPRSGLPVPASRNPPVLRHALGDGWWWAASRGEG